MKQARRVWAWLTLLLFIGGIVSPRLVAAMPADCPMRQAERERLCPAPPAPVEKPACCQKMAAQMARAGTLSRSCCCDMTAAPETQGEAPAILPILSAPDAVLPSAIPLDTTPRTATVAIPRFHRENDTAPRAPPIRSTPPRAPPFA